MLYYCAAAIRFVVIWLLFNFVSVRTFNGFLQSDPCSVMLSGGANRANLVKSVYLNCEQGALFWNRPVGSLFVRFSPTTVLSESQDASSTPKAYQLCLRFPEEHSSQVLVQKMVNMKLKEELNVSDPHFHSRLHCTPIGLDSTVYLFLKTRTNYTADTRPASAGFYYVIEEIPGVAAEPICGQCTEKQFLDSYCSSNFVLKGRMLRELPQGNALEYSVSSLLRRPAFLANIVSEVRPKVGLRTATLLTDCPQGSASIPSPLTEYLVVGNAQIGVARLSCSITLTEFQRLANSKNSTTECELKAE
uniref:Meteorin-like protein n=1 Tax=Ditylenchus dipsaci TaxID=166011 RepID=A0A915DAI3_9BILA